MGRNPLNDRDVDGNTAAWMHDREPEGICDPEMYKCDICKLMTPLEDYNWENRICNECYTEHKDDLPGQDDEVRGKV